VLHPKDVGDRSTLAIMYALRTLGFAIYVPFGENTRTDLILESSSGGLRRVQCKTGRYRRGAVLFATCSSYAHHPHPKITKRDYIGEVDDFAVFCPDLGAVYLIPIEDLPSGGRATLRVDPPRNNQFNGVRFARAYEIAKFDVY
jgi:PD-(D/E)XK endonuclease